MSDDDPRVAKAPDALSYWRFRSQLEREVGGYFSPDFIAQALGHAESEFREKWSNTDTADDEPAENTSDTGAVVAP